MKIHISPTLRRKVSTNFLVLICLCWNFTLQAQANEFVSLADEPILSHWQYVTDHELEQMRGGFVLANGVEIDFSIKKIVFINGMESNIFDFQLPNDVSIEGLRAGYLDKSNFGLGSFVQNRLDNQVISIRNIINLGIRNLNNVSVKRGGFDISSLRFR